MSFSANLEGLTLKEVKEYLISVGVPAEGHFMAPLFDAYSELVLSLSGDLAFILDQNPDAVVAACQKLNHDFATTSVVGSFSDAVVEGVSPLAAAGVGAGGATYPSLGFDWEEEAPATPAGVNLFNLLHVLEHENDVARKEFLLVYHTIFHNAEVGRDAAKLLDIESTTTRAEAVAAIPAEVRKKLSHFKIPVFLSALMHDSIFHRERKKDEESSAVLLVDSLAHGAPWLKDPASLEGQIMSRLIRLFIVAGTTPVWQGGGFNAIWNPLFQLMAHKCGRAEFEGNEMAGLMGVMLRVMAHADVMRTAIPELEPGKFSGVSAPELDEAYKEHFGDDAAGRRQAWSRVGQSYRFAAEGFGPVPAAGVGNFQRTFALMQAEEDIEFTAADELEILAKIPGERAFAGAVVKGVLAELADTSPWAQPAYTLDTEALERYPQVLEMLEKAAAAGAGEAVVKLMRDAAVKQDGMHFTPKALFECVAAEVAAASTPVVEREAPVAVPVPTAAPAFRTKPGRASGLSGASSTAAGGVPSYMRPTAASERRREAVLRGKKAAEAKVNAKEATAFKKVLTVVSGDPLSGLRPVDPTSGPL